MSTAMLVLSDTRAAIALVPKRTAEAAIVMPDFYRRTRGFRHSIDSALAALAALGVSADRLTIEYAGADGPPGEVTSQYPRPGFALDARTRIVLRVSGFGVHDALPYALRDEHAGEVRADAICALFDSPLEKLAVHLRRAGDFFTLATEAPATALRWIEELFGLDASSWSPQRWYAVARLLPALHRVAGRGDGVSLAVALVFGIPVASVGVRAALVPLTESQRTRLGSANAHLGVDAIAGVGVYAEVGVDIVLGPVALTHYRTAACASERAERDALYRLLLPAHLAHAVTERWIVGDVGEGSRIGDAGHEVALGLNSYIATPNVRTGA